LIWASDISIDRRAAVKDGILRQILMRDLRQDRTKSQMGNLKLCENG
jgi:hypothetical protein